MVYKSSRIRQCNVSLEPGRLKNQAKEYEHRFPGHQLDARLPFVIIRHCLAFSGETSLRDNKKQNDYLKRQKLITSIRHQKAQPLH